MYRYAPLGEELVICVTGSREWGQHHVITRALYNVGAWHRKVKLLHGRCDPRLEDEFIDGEPISYPVPWDKALKEPEKPYLGADWHAAGCARGWGWTVKEFPADWAKGFGAGPMRNQAMIDEGPHVVLGFPKGDSKGTRGCLAIALRKHVPILTYEG